MPIGTVFALDFRTSALPTAIVHQPYAPPPVEIVGGGRCLPNQVVVSVIAGRLPEGLALSPAGFFSGTPLREGEWRFVLRAANDCDSTTAVFSLRVDGPPILRLDPAEVRFTQPSDGPPPPPRIIALSSNWNGLPYRIEITTAPWLTASPLQGRTPPAGAALREDPIELTVDAAKLAPGVYRGWLRVEAWQAANSPRIPIVLEVRKP